MLPQQPAHPLPFLLPADRYPSGRTFRGRAEVKLCQQPGYTLSSEDLTSICAEFRGQVRAAGEGEGTWVVVLEVLPHIGVLGLMTAGCVIQASPGDSVLMRKCCKARVIPKKAEEPRRDSWGGPWARMGSDGTAGCLAQCGTSPRAGTEFAGSKGCSPGCK